MRFLHHDVDLLQLTFELLLWGGRTGQQGAGDKSKIESLIQLLVSRFYKLDFKKISSQSKSLRTITEEEIRYLHQPTAFQHAKDNGFNYERYVVNDDPLSQDPLPPTPS